MKHFWLYLRGTVPHTFSAPTSGHHEVHLPCGREPGAGSGHGSGRDMIFPTRACPTALNKGAGMGWGWEHRSTLISWPSSRTTVIQRVQKTYHLKEWEVALKRVSAVSSSKFSASAKKIGKLQETTWKTTDSLKEKINFRSRCCQKSLAVSNCQQAANLKKASGASMGSGPNSKPPVSLWITLITC